MAHHAIVLVALALASASGLAALGQDTGQAGLAQPGVYRPGNGVTVPTPLRRQEPRYTSAALRAKIQGEVWVHVVVGADGTVTEARVVRSLDRTFGLDEEALSAARAWRFKPGTLDGKPVPVLATLVLEFRIHSRGQEPRIFAPAPLSDAEFLAGTVSIDTPGLVKPRPTVRVTPKYTSDAMRAKLQGTVTVEAVVGVDGRVSRVRIKESLDPTLGLDDNALQAALQWTFEAATLGGSAVPVVIDLTLEFKIH